jgi:hypothetical protein
MANSHNDNIIKKIKLKFKIYLLHKRMMLIRYFYNFNNTLKYIEYFKH